MEPNERAAFGIAPLIAPAVWTTLLEAPEPHFAVFDYLGTVLIVSVFGVPAAYLVALCAGLPLYLLFRNRGWINFWSLLLGAAALGSAPTLITLLLMRDAWEAGHSWKLHALFAATGASVGFVFWCVLRYWPTQAR